MAKILVIDDERSIRNTLKEVLEYENHEIDTAVDGPEGIEMFAKDKYEIKIVSSRNDAWKNVDFIGSDGVLYCAGIAHVKQTKKTKELYYKINCDLAVDIAQKAKSSDIKQFIFLSSMAVYGTSNPAIDENTAPNPKSNDFYGGSKLKAERELKKLEDAKFKLCIVRPPMVYGNGCKGNFQKLARLAKITPVFPSYPNKRSMIYICNLCNFLCGLIDEENTGIFLPQNTEYVNTTELVKHIAECYGRRIKTTKLFNPLIKLFVKHTSVFEKLFGDLYYVNQTHDIKCNLFDFDDSIKYSIQKLD